MHEMNADSEGRVFYVVLCLESYWTNFYSIWYLHVKSDVIKFLMKPSMNM
jgi:hypothetical protein